MAAILIIDDSATIRQLLSATLAGEGHTVVAARNGVEGLRKAKSMRANLVITDINMTEMDGLTLVSKLRRLEAYGRVPIILITTESGADKKAIARKAGATGWITKPFNPQKLLTAVRRVLP